MDTKPTDDPKRNPDPITGEPGSRPVATGTGAAGGGLAGAAAGAAVGGPVGAAVGAVGGAVAGAYAGKGIAEAIDPTVEENYWRENHARQAWADSTRTYDDFAPAYRTGYMGVAKYQGRDFTAAEPDLRRDYESSEGNATVPWMQARPAMEAAWKRASGIVTPQDTTRGIRGNP